MTRVRGSIYLEEKGIEVVTSGCRRNGHVASKDHIETRRSKCRDHWKVKALASI